ncbi:MAG: hypothetical protein CVU05_00155 [Bacteroidetes bacterium HGW-Bacteroidetes-21]|jgi:hypothetical protein|nr:MAG: hypothetical protein CVU05_00155 [Bacteroidetes bacterium HGW-Bacteroidetes-21]
MKQILFLLLTIISAHVNGQNMGLYFINLQKNYIITPHVASLYPTNNFTIEFWVRIDRRPPTDMSLINKAECVTNKTSFTCSIKSDNKIIFGYNCDGNCNNTSGFKIDSALNLGQCYHVAITYSNLGPKIYLDGILQTGSLISGSIYCGDLYQTPEPLRIGAYRYRADTIGGYLSGMMDEIRIWDHVRSQSQISTMYQQRLTGNETGLLLYYNFSESVSGSMATIVNHATLTGSALNGTTQSINPTSPNTTQSCFNFTDIEYLADNSSTLRLFPNPVNDQIIINSENPSDLQLTYNADIMDISGRIVMKLEDISLPANMTVNQLDKGIYLIRMYNHQTEYELKFIKE